MSHAKGIEVDDRDLYLIGAHKADFVAKGLYAGLKQRDGLPTPLPLVLSAADEYVNAGFLDALPCSFIRDLETNDVHLHLVHEGALRVSLYVLLISGEVFHCDDKLLHGSSKSKIMLPSTCFRDPNTRLIYFRIQPVDSSATLKDWFYTVPSKPWHQDIDPLLLISRTLGDSLELVKRFAELCHRHFSLKESYPELLFLPVPNLKVYESDPHAFEESKNLISSSLESHVSLVPNPYNLGGGGNMCLAIHEEVVRNKSRNQFAMLDSDTTLPFRTFYWASLIAANLAKRQGSHVRVPIVLYSSRPNQVLESGGLFGRGNWGIVSATPTQPCIQPLRHRESISKPKLQADLAGISYTDYPPFIFSLFSAEQHQLASHFLPVPFFLRGDDIEMGQHLRAADIPCDVDGSLLVFQEPKHSLWHEWMAILHGTCLVLAAAASDGRAASGFPELQRYFDLRSTAHGRIHDTLGLTAYERVLDRLIELIRWPEEELIVRFHDPAAYLSCRDLNREFSVANFRTLEAISNKGGLPTEQYLRLPFLYFEQAYSSALSNDSPLPQRIGLVNASQKTAAILEPHSISSASIETIQKRIKSKVNDLFETNSIELAHRCLALTDRKQIVDKYLSQYPISP